MKILFYGGQKSGKSSKAEAAVLKICGIRKPCYIATYDNSYNDAEMAERVVKHRAQRGDKFITIEEPKNLPSVIEPCNCYLIDCISMWLMNNLDQSQEKILKQLEKISEIDADIVFVLNNVNEGVIPLNCESRKFVDMTGIAGQYLASVCDEVYEVVLGIERRLK